MISTKQNMSILLVEDNILNQRLMTINLSSLGHKVTVANNGLEGVELFKKKSIRFDFNGYYDACNGWN